MSVTGEQLRDEGIRKVKANLLDTWKLDYKGRIEQWFCSLPYAHKFTGEDMTADAKAGLAEPHHPNAWGACAGAMIRRWLKEGSIVVCGWQKATKVQAHARRYPLYMKVA